MVTAPQRSIFISYRRSDRGADIARLLQTFLEQVGFRVFLDVDGLDSGHFDRQLLDEIEHADSFIVVLAPQSLDRCADPDDWMRREIVHAVEHRRKIVPVTLPGFKWPASGTLPEEMREITQHHAFEYSHMHWGSTKDRLLRMLGAESTEPVEPNAVPPDGPRPIPGSAPESIDPQPPWAEVCIRLLNEIRHARFAWFRKFDPRTEPFDEADLAEESAAVASAMHALDSAPELGRCRELVVQGRELDSPLSPFPTRVRAAHRLVSALPMARDEDPERVHDVLFATHLLNLASVLRLYAEFHESPDAELIAYVRRAAAFAAAHASETRIGAEVFGIDLMLELAIETLALEIHLASNPPSPEEIDMARRRGHLGYGDLWRTRLRDADRLGRLLDTHVINAQASMSEDAESSRPVLNELHRLASYAGWIGMACEILRNPERPFDDLYRSELRGIAPSTVASSGSGATESITARGAWRTLEVMTSVHGRSSIAEQDLSQHLVQACLAPGEHARAVDRCWSTPPAAPWRDLLRSIDSESSIVRWWG